MYRMANSGESERRRYRSCTSSRELCDAARFRSSCPLCDGHTLACVERSPHSPLPEPHPEKPALNPDGSIAGSGLINRISVGLDDVFCDLRL
jgi:hypothetical protein